MTQLPLLHRGRVPRQGHSPRSSRACRPASPITGGAAFAADLVAPPERLRPRQAPADRDRLRRDHRGVRHGLTMGAPDRAVDRQRRPGERQLAGAHVGRPGRPGGRARDAAAARPRRPRGHAEVRLRRRAADPRAVERARDAARVAVGAIARALLRGDRRRRSTRTSSRVGDVDAQPARAHRLGSRRDVARARRRPRRRGSA